MTDHVDEELLRYPSEIEPVTTQRFTDSETGQVYDAVISIDPETRKGMKIINQKVMNFESMLKQFQELMSVTIEKNVKAKLIEVGAMRSEQTDQLEMALAKCLAEMGCIIPEKTSQATYGSKTASLEDLQYFANPFLQKHGLSITFRYYLLGDKETIKGILSHVSGQFECNLMDVYIKAKGSFEKGNKKELEQSDIEAAYTYTKKRLFALFLGLHCGK